MRTVLPGLFACLACARVLAAQSPARDSGAAARAVAANAPIVLDGVPDEPVWYPADSFADFTQSEPEEGGPATERAVVRLLRTPAGLYVGLWAYDSARAAIRHAQLRRDADFGSDDVFTLLIDPLRDRRSGYVFAVNPNGAMRDAEVVNFETNNVDWNGVWGARARLAPVGWTAKLVGTAEA